MRHHDVGMSLGGECSRCQHAAAGQRIGCLYALSDGVRGVAEQLAQAVKREGLRLGSRWLGQQVYNRP